MLGVRVPTDGVVARVMVHGGQEVRAGQPIGAMEDLDLAAQIAESEGAVELARRDGAAARQAGDMGAWRGAQIRLAAAQRTLAFERQRSRATLLVAPFAGEVLELNLDQQIGQHLLAGEALCTVAALDSMSVEFDVPEERIAALRIGQPVALKVAAYPGDVFHGRVSEVGWRGYSTPRTGAHYRVRARLANPGHTLRPRMSGVARVTLGRGALLAQLFDPLGRAVAMKWW